MEIWIRSQNGEVILKCNDFFIHKSEFKELYYICTNNIYLLGTYSSKEKAMKVLDDIQEHIKRHLTGDISIFNAIYEMPEDNEVDA